ncbi:MAG: galactose-1-phosphate uridylyltransferase [Candidatus Eremiobacteraeota bacterium]|nr:galactose-1-phosphate uridylyltransferase [Candidatus Eremiobacteraeota bacterium]
MHLRWHPLLGEWVATATHRQDRTFFPPEDYCPLCPTKPGKFPTEVPAESYDIVVFENKFPSLQRNPPQPEVASSALEPVAPSHGACEVVLYTPDHHATLAELPVRRIEHLVRVLRDRTRDLSAREEVVHVYPFENKGAAIGVTLSHPHGQIYAYPFVPPVIAREIAQARAHRASTGRCLFCDVRDAERADGRRMLAEEDGWVAYLPFFARYPYETHLAPARCVRALPDLDESEVRGLARILKRVLRGFDALFGVSFPYIMALHQAPKTDDPYHLHVEFYPPMRSAKRLKYLAGSEAGAGMFINDTLPEVKAAELREKIEARGALSGR